ncbi:MAG: response regulator [Spirochaetota bacterium]|nr:response regulator [Spirochaetota bacterium]
MKILIADDSKMTRTIVRTVMQSNGLSVNSIIEAKDGVEALKILEQEHFELLIVDWLMPELDGLQLVKKMKKSTKLSTIPIIMMTVVSEYDKVYEALSLGIEDYIVKPLNENALWNRIYSIISKNRRCSLETIELTKREYESSNDKERFIDNMVDALYQDRNQYIFGVNLFLKMFDKELIKTNEDKEILKTMFELYDKRISNKKSLSSYCEKLLTE